MSLNKFVSAHVIRFDFTQAISQLYRAEVPKYGDLLSLVKTVNDASNNHQTDELLSIERHGAIRLGTAAELSTMRRLFSVMGMLPVDYYDLSVANIPVHSTAFRAIDEGALEDSPFRVFTSLLRLDLIDDALCKKAEKILQSRQIFSKELQALLNTADEQGGLTADQAAEFIREALETFRWHKEATVDAQTYRELNQSHRLIADVVSFKGPHINHLTPKVLDIDHAQSLFAEQGFKAKENIEGPPVRRCPILLRQTSFLALEEEVVFLGGEKGTHTARFGEIEQRGVALTPKGRALYDRLLNKARGNTLEGSYAQRLSQSFKEFPDDHEILREDKLAYYHYSANLESLPVDKTMGLKQLIAEGALHFSPITYEDFLPVSAAGIFQSNLSDTQTPSIPQSPNQASFEEALGAPVMESFALYDERQKSSLSKALHTLGGDEMLCL